MTALFKRPKIVAPAVAAPPPTPTIDDAQRDQNETDRLRRRRGLRSNVFAGLGMAVPGSSQKVLTGQ